MVLLLAAFAVPAAAPAACHDARMAAPHAQMAMAMTTTGDSTSAMLSLPDRKAVPIHGCIGCIPPSTWIAARIAPVAPADAATLIARVAVLDIGTAAAPALRPPRTA